MSAPSAIPTSAQRDRKIRRCGVNANPTASATKKNRAEYLLSQAIPPAAPTAIHQRGSAPRTSRTSQSAIDGQRARPISSGLTFAPNAIKTGAPR